MHWEAMMRKLLVLGTTAVLLGGCALPVPLQIASWALDGLSVLATQKSVADHGISIIAEKDCAVWRGVVEGELCRDEIDPDVLVAEDVSGPDLRTGFVPDPAKIASSPVSATPTPRVSSTQQVIAERRQKGVVFSHAMSRVEHRQPSVPVPVHAMRAQAVVKKVTPSQRPTVRLVKQPVEVTKWSPPKKPEYLDHEPLGGIYFVIGSFRNPDNAARMSDRHRQLAATMIAAKLGGNKIYRVVVGPVEKGKEKTAHKVLRRAGLVDTWAMRVNPSDWSIADQKPKASGEIARLSD